MNMAYTTNEADKAAKKEERRRQRKGPAGDVADAMNKAFEKHESDDIAHETTNPLIRKTSFPLANHIPSTQTFLPNSERDMPPQSIDTLLMPALVDNMIGRNVRGQEDILDQSNDPIPLADTSISNPIPSKPPSSSNSRPSDVLPQSVDALPTPSAENDPISPMPTPSLNSQIRDVPSRGVDASPTSASAEADEQAKKPRKKVDMGSTPLRWSDRARKAPEVYKSDPVVKSGVKRKTEDQKLHKRQFKQQKKASKEDSESESDSPSNDASPQDNDVAMDSDDHEIGNVIDDAERTTETTYISAYDPDGNKLEYQFPSHEASHVKLMRAKRTVFVKGMICGPLGLTDVERTLRLSCAPEERFQVSVQGLRAPPKEGQQCLNFWKRLQNQMDEFSMHSPFLELTMSTIIHCWGVASILKMLLTSKPLFWKACLGPIPQTKFDTGQSLEATILSLSPTLIFYGPEQLFLAQVRRSGSEDVNCLPMPKLVIQDLEIYWILLLLNLGILLFQPSIVSHMSQLYLHLVKALSSCLLGHNIWLWESHLQTFPRQTYEAVSPLAATFVLLPRLTKQLTWFAGRFKCQLKKTTSSGEIQWEDIIDGESQIFAPMVVHLALVMEQYH
ncbi:hypothetical protein K438DRAFT_2157348 [Mycena galopus ATCC 62051]|nr:hypothetical protein K438DRAFT_2157348 [Mycena galopus ATCC 62051]